MAEQEPSVIGLDLGTKSGFAVLDSRGRRIESGFWPLLKRGEPSACRYIAFKQHLVRLLKKYPGVPVAYEHVRRHQGTRAAHVYGGLFAVLEVVAHEFEVELLVYEPTKWKKLATGNGGASKLHYVRAANRIFRMKMTVKKREDEAAALGIAYAAFREREDDQSTNQTPHKIIGIARKKVR